MIQSLSLRNLKCFEELDLRLAPLTLLTGFNAAGKSTTLQTLLLMAQTLRAHLYSGELRLNGPLVSLGTPGEVLREGELGGSLKLGFQVADHAMSWEFAYKDAGSRRFFQVETLRTTSVDQTNVYTSNELLGLIPDNDLKFQKLCRKVENLFFLSATRNAAQEVFPVPTDLLPAGDPGCYGQFAAWQLSRFSEDTADPDRCVPGSPEVGTLRKEVNEWLNLLFPGAEANVGVLQKTDLVRLEFRTTAGGEWKRPANVGYGLSYAFPMLVAGMCSEAGQTLIIDSPEAHLHPRGQSLAGRFAARIASAGQQVIAETHSDHFLNGVRRAIQEGILKPEDVAIYFFDRDADAKVQEFAVDAEGNISNWPSGFFDQAERDLASLAGWA